MSHAPIFHAAALQPTITAEPAQSPNPAQSLNPTQSPKPNYWRTELLAGRFVELSGQAQISVAFILVHQAQHLHEPVAWITIGNSAFYPPDAEEQGIDLRNLPCIQLNDVQQAAKAAEHLLRSAAFGVLILDLGAETLSPIMQTRLSSLARKQNTILLCLTKKYAQQPSLGSLVSLRLHGSFQQLCGERITHNIEAIKDKRMGPGWKQQTSFVTPAGFFKNQLIHPPANSIKTTPFPKNQDTSTTEVTLNKAARNQPTSDHVIANAS